MSQRADPQAGFSLLEAIVALAVIGGALGAVYTLQAQLVTTLDRARAASIRADVEASATDFARTINPAQTPSGRTAVGGWTFVWTSAPAGPAREGRTGMNRAAGRIARMYDVTVAVYDRDGEQAGPAVTVAIAGFAPGAGSGDAAAAPAPPPTILQ